MIDQMGGRKVFLGIAVILLGVAIDFLHPGGLSQNLLYLLVFTSSAFFLANGIEHVATAVKHGKKAKNGISGHANTVPNEEVMRAVQAFYAEQQNTTKVLDTLSQSMITLNKTLHNAISRRAGATE